MSTLEDWISSLLAEFGIEPEAVDRDEILDVAREVAHRVARPAAPLTTYLLGVAVGRGERPEDAAARVNALVAPWPERDQNSGH
jgi:Domain of unknown function (DUF6457)